MMTREQAIKRLTDIEREIAELRDALDREWAQTGSPDPTKAFLDKCGGWEDDRSPEEIVAEVDG